MCRVLGRISTRKTMNAETRATSETMHQLKRDQLVETMHQIENDHVSRGVERDEV